MGELLWPSRMSEASDAQLIQLTYRTLGAGVLLTMLELPANHSLDLIALQSRMGESQRYRLLWTVSCLRAICKAGGVDLARSWFSETNYLLGGMTPVTYIRGWPQRDSMAQVGAAKRWFVHHLQSGYSKVGELRSEGIH